MRKAFYFTFALACLLAFGLASCDMGLTPQNQNPNTNGANTGNTEQDKLLEVKDTVGGQPLVITITKSKPNVSKSVARSVATGNYYHITLGGTTISWGTVTVVASSGNIGFFPDASSPCGTTAFQGTLTANNEVKIPKIPVKNDSIVGVDAGVSGGKGTAIATFTDVGTALNPTTPVTPVIPTEDPPENPVTPAVPPVASQRTLTITGIPAEFEGKYLRFEAGSFKTENNPGMIYGFVPDTVKNNNGDFDLLPGLIKSGKVELKVYSQIYTEKGWTYNTPYTGSGTFDYFWLSIYSSVGWDDCVYYFCSYTSVTFSAAAISLDANTFWPFEKTLNITGIPNEYKEKYARFMAYDSVEWIEGFAAAVATNNDNSFSTLYAAEIGDNGSVSLKLYKQAYEPDDDDSYRQVYIPYTGKGEFMYCYLSIYNTPSIDWESLEVELTTSKNVVISNNSVNTLSVASWNSVFPPVFKDAKVGLEIISEPVNTKYTTGEKYKLDLSGLKVKVTLPDNIDFTVPLFGNETSIVLEGSSEYFRYYPLGLIEWDDGEGDEIFSEAGETTVDIDFTYDYEFTDDKGRLHIYSLREYSYEPTFTITVLPDLSEPDSRLTGTWIAEYEGIGYEGGGGSDGSTWNNEYSYKAIYTLKFTTASAFTMVCDMKAETGEETSESLKGTYTVNSNNVVVLRGRNMPSDGLSGVVTVNKIVFDAPGLPDGNLVFTRH